MWLAPLFLLGLAGLALPLWLHRFARDTDDKRRYASLMLMEAAEVQRSRKRQLKYWLLLLLRLLLLAALVLAFAGPLLPWRSGGLGGAGAQLHVVVLDTSLSMRAGGAFERARDAARAELEAVGGNDQAMLIVADHRIRVLADPSFASQRAEWMTQLNAQSASLSRLDYGLLMTSLPGLIGNGTRRVACVTHHRSARERHAAPLRRPRAAAGRRVRRDRRRRRADEPRGGERRVRDR